MATLTLRDIDEDVMNRMRTDAKRERRSLNSQFLTVLDRGLGNVYEDSETARKAQIEKQNEALRALCGSWEGEFPPIERTFGREIDLDL